MDILSQNKLSRAEWKSAKSGYGAALKRGRDFMRQCCAHMPIISGGSRGMIYSDAVVLESAREYATRNEWKHGDPSCYEITLFRTRGNSVTISLSSHLVVVP